ncbi:D-3-phosphoglycerate dehydrogenase [Microbacterium terrae]|uniref:D-3-phosphoglycerate dehydrogenase n=1 Tax=Microbacterium terrae TaxID=69369 RepID=A0A0M2H5W9_9MICO|nr:phosphoglycerate dehydrogenase [Microbacterium terrae]KJL39930.1 D-3-phosphoglycerate dehydrogenase [Microbacterium terrae]MBP1076868.1 D-3-phosphoglycerate dehydrogenase [Microbacterium terrae]GLJ99463.1 oxidoreductase [Microbacterium terrae]
MKVLVTPTSLCRQPDSAALESLRRAVGEVVLNPFGRPMTESELIDALPGVDGVIAGLDDYSADALAAADRLRVVARYGVGTNNVDLDAARARGIVVTRTPGANALAVAELAVGLTFAVARGIPRLDAAVRAGDWPRGEGRELTGGVFGVVGFGAIGRLVAERARGIGMTPIAYDPMLPDEVFAAAGVERCDLDDLCRRSDVLSLHVPLLPETRHLLDERRLALLPADAIVVNTARGGLIDEAAARAALDAGRIYGVAIDAYETEPPSASPLVGHPRVVSTPHSGGHTREAVARMSEQSIDDLITVLRGEASPNAVSSPL